MEKFILSSFGSGLKICQAASLSDRTDYIEPNSKKQVAL